MQNVLSIRPGVVQTDERTAFPVVVILVPDRGFDPERMMALFTVPEGVALVLLEYPRQTAEPNAFSARLENALMGQAARRSSNIVREGMLLEKDQVYIVASGLNPEIRDGRFGLVHRPIRDGEASLPDFILAGLAGNFRRRLTVVLSGQAGLLGADIVKKEGGFVYFLDDPEFRRPMNAVSLIDGMVAPVKLATALAANQPRTRLSTSGTPAASKTSFPFRPNLCKLLQQEVFPLLTKDRRGHGPHRVWIAGDPDGLMAYSTAIGLTEYLRLRKMGIRIQVFSTGLDRRQVQRSRAGLFEKDSLSALCSEWREEYFTRRDDAFYQVCRSLQHSCVFATHHLVADPPFARCDLVICADSLALLTDVQRKKLFQSFHYALNPGGSLLLLDNSAAAGIPLSTQFAMVDTVPGLYLRKTETAFAETIADHPRPASDAEKEAEKIILSGYVPPAVLVDEELRVVRFYGVISPYLRRNQDRPSLHLLKIVRDELVFELSDLLAKVSRTRRPAAVDGIFLADELRPECRLEVLPVSGNPSHRLVIIREKESTGEKKVSRPRTSENARDRHIKSLEKQGQRLRYQLQTAHHLFRQNQQQLKEGNEEMLASNEELQSVNEELDSINEDLQVRNTDLELQAHRNRSVISAIQRPLVVIMGNGRVDIVNRAFLELFGLQRRAIEGHPWISAAGSMFDLPELKETLQSMENADVLDFELRHRFPGMEEKTLAISANKIRGEAGMGGGVLLMMEDVTDRRRTERFKDEFIGIASHELKTPATTIKAYTQLLRRELNESGNKEPAKMAEHLSEQVDRLTNLAKDLLDMSKASQGQLNLRRTCFMPDRLLAEIVEDMQPTTPGRLLLSEMPPLPEIWADRERIRQVLVNLLSNAIKYSPGNTDILMRCAAVKKNIQFTVQDFGIGMTGAMLQNLFTRYYRSDDPASARVPGMGLGLYISAEIVRRHGGSIMVSSEKDKGSTFTVQIPLDRRDG